MSHNFSQIREYLLSDADVSIPRHLLILAGDEKWHFEAVREMLRGLEADSLWVDVTEENNITNIFPSTTAKKAHHYLGGEKRVVIFNAFSDFEVDAFAAISGIVVGSGVLILLMPAKENWNRVYSSRFGQRMLKSLNDYSKLTLIKQDDKEFIFAPVLSIKQSSTECPVPFLTFDQKAVVTSIEKQVLNDTNTPVVLVSDRGRGKSASLGIAAARLIEAGIKNIIITAPRLRATDIIFKHIAELLPDALNSRGRVEYGESVVQFYSPDHLLEENISADVLLVDEAAAIPVPLLTSFLNKYSQCVFATTVHGYEGTGRGFALRFFKVLDEKHSNWLKLKMETPVRWPPNDYLEKWMFNLLCLDAEIIGMKSLGEIEYGLLENKFITKEQLANNHILLNEVFALLVIAHYRTRPKDLKNLLDDEDLSLYVTLYKEHVLAVALVIKEGQFPDSLSTLVYQGERRPQGHLLAQALTYHCGIENAATLEYARVMRIAVHPDLQKKGIGTSLLDFVICSEKQNGRDAIGASFGMNKVLLKFWKKLKFDVVRIGFTREQTSGEHAAIMLMPLNEEGQKIHEEASSRFERQLPYWFDDVLKDIPSDIKTWFDSKKKQEPELSKYDNEDLQSYYQCYRNYELCITSINKFVKINHTKIEEESFSDVYRNILNLKVINKFSWKDIRKNMNLSGQQETRKLFHEAIESLMR